MHECPNCGFICDCDGEDLWYDEAPADCACECEELENQEDYDED